MTNKTLPYIHCSWIPCGTMRDYIWSAERTTGPGWIRYTRALELARQIGAERDLVAWCRSRRPFEECRMEPYGG